MIEDSRILLIQMIFEFKITILSSLRMKTNYKEMNDSKLKPQKKINFHNENITIVHRFQLKMFAIDAIVITCTLFECTLIRSSNGFIVIVVALLFMLLLLHTHELCQYFVI